jgi:hypothetical protein
MPDDPETTSPAPPPESTPVTPPAAPPPAHPPQLIVRPEDEKVELFSETSAKKERR